MTINDFVKMVLPIWAPKQKFRCPVNVVDEFRFEVLRLVYTTLCGNI